MNNWYNRRYFFYCRAYRLRKVLGGGMRQTGILAAACLYGLSKASENMTQDHKNAKKLAQGINESSNGIVSVDFDNVQTNIVHMKILKNGLNTPDLLQRLKIVRIDYYLNFCIFFNF